MCNCKKMTGAMDLKTFTFFLSFWIFFSISKMLKSDQIYLGGCRRCIPLKKIDGWREGFIVLWKETIIYETPCWNYFILYHIHTTLANIENSKKVFMVRFIQLHYILWYCMFIHAKELPGSVLSTGQCPVTTESHCSNDPGWPLWQKTVKVNNLNRSQSPAVPNVL